MADRMVAVEAQVESVEQAVRRLENALGLGLVWVCGYEFLALTTKALPPLSRGMWRLRPSVRALVWAGVIAIGTDHFFTRRFT